MIVCFPFIVCTRLTFVHDPEANWLVSSRLRRASNRSSKGPVFHRRSTDDVYSVGRTTEVRDVDVQTTFLQGLGESRERPRGQSGTGSGDTADEHESCTFGTLQ
jgi:hypothetical protein